MRSSNAVKHAGCTPSCTISLPCCLHLLISSSSPPPPSSFSPSPLVEDHLGWATPAEQMRKPLKSLVEWPNNDDIEKSMIRNENKPVPWTRWSDLLSFSLQTVSLPAQWICQRLSEYGLHQSTSGTWVGSSVRIDTILCVCYSPTEHLTDAWDPCPQTNEQQQKKSSLLKVRVSL